MRLLGAIMQWSLHNRAIVVVATCLLVVFGIDAARKLPVDAIPDVTNGQVQIITAAPALSPVEVEQYVTVPVERAMSGLPHVADVRSISKYGLSVVTVVFTDETDIYFARQLVTERMRQAEDAVPAQYGRPEMGPISTALGEVYQFTVRGEGYTLMQLEELLDWYIGPQLRTVPGIVESNSFGGENKEYQVVVDPQRLQAAGISAHEVVAALERSNGNAGGGYIERHRAQIVIGTYGLVHSLADVESVVIGATKDGVPITISNLATVRYGPKLKRGAASIDGKGEAVIGVALMLKGANSRTVTEAVKAKIEALAPTLPKGVRIEPFYDRAALVNRTIRTVVKNLAEGAALVIAVLFILLGDMRAGLVVAATIPLSMLFALILMNVTGVSGNLMSLGAIDFGLIVDAAVIIVENAVRRIAEARRRKGAPLDDRERLDVIRDAALEVRSASVFGEAIIAIVYLPILTLRGIEGKLFQPMAVTVLFAISGAFVLSLTVVPVLASFWLKPSSSDHETWIMRKAHALYQPVLTRILRHRVITLTSGVVLLVLAVGVFTQVGAEFVPTLDEGDLLVEARRLPGISLSESLATEKRLQDAVLAIPEVKHVISRTGAPEVATDPMGIEQSDVYVLLKPRSEWRRGVSKQELAKEIDKTIDSAVPEIATAISQPIQMRTNELIAGARSDVAAQVYGPDLGDQVADAVKRVRGAVDVRATQAGGLRYLRIIPDRARLARYGLTVEDVNMLTQVVATWSPSSRRRKGQLLQRCTCRPVIASSGAVSSRAS